MNRHSSSYPPYRIAFVLEQTLGHVTHARNLCENVGSDPEVAPTWLPIPYGAEPGRRRVPGIAGKIADNWSIQASRRARVALRQAGAPHAFDAIFMHTQVTTLFSAHLLRWGHGVISLDATPRNFDTLGAAYRHRPGPPVVETLKDALNRRAFQAARRLVTWCDWARASLIHDYGVAASRVTTIPPGTNIDLWQTARPPRRSGEKLRALFVGGDFQRKGGDLLVEVFQNQLRDDWELDLVTGAAPPLPDGVRVHQGLAPNSAPLRRLFADADVFVLPTRADCLAMVLMEAMAAGLPIITTRVGALGEAVEDGKNGFLVPPNDGVALAAALDRLQRDPALRQRMGTASFARAGERFDARRNQRRLLALLKQVAGSPLSG